MPRHNKPFNQPKGPRQAAATGKPAERAAALYRQGQYQASATLCCEILARQPASPDIQHLLALNLVQSGNPAAALDHVRAALAFHPKHAVYLNTLGDLLAKTGQIDDAIAALQASAAAAPDYRDPHYNLVRLYTGRLRLDQANAVLMPQLARFPDDPELHNLLGIVLAESGRAEQAVESYSRAIQLDARRAQYHNNLGVAYARLGQPDLARQAYQAAISIDPAYAQPWNNLALAHVGQRHWQPALECFTRYAELVPADPVAWLQIGQIFRMRAEHEMAIAAFDKSQALGGDRSQLLTALAYVLFDLGEVDSAIEHLIDALQLNARNWDAIDAISYLLLQSGRYQMLLDFNVDFELNESIPYGKRCRLVVARAIACYHLQQFESCLADLALAEQLFRHEPNQYEGNLLEVMIYQRYLVRLFAVRQRQPVSLSQRSQLHVVGESHCLSPAWEQVRGGSAVVVPHLVRGAKAWHLGQGSINQYQRNFVEVCALLPPQADIVFCFGEIDCRLDEGFIAHARRNPDADIDLNVVETVARYVDFVRHVCAGSDWRIYLQGVPAPCAPKGEVEPEWLQRQIHIVRLFNLALRRRAEQVGFGFVDVHALTVADDGLSNQRWHLDAYHLHPDYIHQFF